MHSFHIGDSLLSSVARLPNIVKFNFKTLFQRLDEVYGGGCQLLTIWFCFYCFSCVDSGQGTVALEFMEQVPNLDVIIVPISGKKL